jgi:branched-chain amino acid transport system ATP-binding protein
MSGHLSIQNLTKRFGGLVAIDDVTLDFKPGSLSAVIGPNGAGKTTLFNMVTGHLSPTSGSIQLDDVDLIRVPPRKVVRLGVGRAFQVASLFPTFTAIEAMAAAVMSHRGQLMNFWSRFPEPSAMDRARELLAIVGTKGIEDRRCSTLSHGDKKMLDIAMALALEPNVLLLDEPTAGMGREESRVMIDRIHRLWESERMTLIFIEHDMEIVFGIAQNVHVLRYGSLLASGSPEQIKNDEKVIEAYLGCAE